MRGFVSIILVSSFLSFPVMAQTYEEVQQQQQLYSERVRAETELQMQREEMDRIKEESKRAIEEQKYQIEQQQDEILKLKRKSQFRYVSPDLEIGRETSINKQLLQEMKDQREEERTQAFVNEKSKESSVAFNDEYLAETGKAMAKNVGFNSEQVSRILLSTKYGILKVEERANQGSVVDQRKLALLFLNGEDVRKNNEEGIRWLKKAADNGDAEAQAILANLYFEGKVLPKDEKMCADLILKSALQGYSEAQFIVGGLYNLGICVPQDDLKSYEWYRRAAERGHANAQYMIGSRYFYGKVVPQDDVEAAYWFMLSGINHADLLETEHNKMVLAAALLKLSPQQKKIVGTRVINWEPLRTQEEKNDFDRRIAAAEEMMKSNLTILSFSKDQAEKMLAAYKRHLFGDGKVREYTVEQMNELRNLVKSKLAEQKEGDSNRYAKITEQLIAELEEK